jgi:hypothetical protein
MDNRKLDLNKIDQIHNWIISKEIAIIVATRKTIKDLTPASNVKDIIGYEFSSEENCDRNRELSAVLLRSNFGIKRISCSSVEKLMTSNESPRGEYFLVVNINDNRAFIDIIKKLGEYFNQDFVLLNPKESDTVYAYGTNYSNEPGFGKEVVVGELFKNIQDEILASAFGYQARVASQYIISQQPIELETFKCSSIGAKMSITIISKSILSELNL